MAYRRGPVEGSHVIGVDGDPARRPGVPMMREGGGEGAEPIATMAAPEKLHRAGLAAPTPVYGTAQPPRGFSGALRRMAYDVPEHLPGHWMMLLLADRVDVMEDRMRDVARPLEERGWDRTAGIARHPLALITGAVIGAMAVRQLRRPA